MGYTVNVEGNCVQAAKSAGYHAYYASGVTAIETREPDRNKAIRIASQFGKVLYAFV